MNIVIQPNRVISLEDFVEEVLKCYNNEHLKMSIVQEDEHINISLVSGGEIVCSCRTDNYLMVYNDVRTKLEESSHECILFLSNFIRLIDTDERYYKMYKDMEFNISVSAGNIE